MAENKTDYDALKVILQKRLNEKRYFHSLCVADEAKRLAEKYGGDSEKAYLAGLLHSRIGQALLKSALDVRLSAPCKMLSDKDLRILSAAIKQKNVAVLGTKGFPDAQVTAGGAELSQFTDTLESTLSPGLFAAGEILDIDGRCGGYNLTFAWSSGRLAGAGAARKVRE